MTKVAARAKRTRTVLIGRVPVDTANLLLVDPWKAKEVVDAWQTWCERTDLNEYANAGHISADFKWGLTVHTGRGDGYYPVTAKVDNKGDVVSVTVHFLGSVGWDEAEPHIDLSDYFETFGHDAKAEPIGSAKTAKTR